MKHLILILSYALTILPGCKSKVQESQTQAIGDAYKSQEWYQEMQKTKKGKLATRLIDDMHEDVYAAMGTQPLTYFVLSPKKEKIFLKSPYSQKASGHDTIYMSPKRDSRYALSTVVKIKRDRPMIISRIVDTENRYKIVDYLTQHVSTDLKSETALDKELARAKRAYAKFFKTYASVAGYRVQQFLFKSFLVVVSVLVGVVLTAYVSAMYSAGGDPITTGLIFFTTIGVVVSVFFGLYYLTRDHNDKIDRLDEVRKELLKKPARN